MRKIKLYTVISSDGSYARNNGDMDWALGYPGHEDYCYRTFIAGADTVLMSREYYTLLMSHDLCWPFDGQTSHIITESEFYTSADKNIVPMSEATAIAEIREMKLAEGGDIWLAGDMELARTMARHGLIDEVIKIILPVALNDGKAFDLPEIFGPEWMVDAENCANDVLRVIFRKTIS